MEGIKSKLEVEVEKLKIGKGCVVFGNGSTHDSYWIEASKALAIIRRHEAEREKMLLTEDELDLVGGTFSCKIDECPHEGCDLENCMIFKKLKALTKTEAKAK